MGKIGSAFRAINRYNVNAFFNKLRTDGLTKTVKNTFAYLRRAGEMETDLQVPDYLELVDPTEHLTVPQFDDVKVSIVIPVYNHFRETYNCIRSIINHTGDVTYEIIIGDDCSTDETLQIDSMISNVIVNRNQQNLGFTLNCNAASEKARGDYILFLNNDTIVGEDWLSPLVTLIESDDSIGMVGSKLIYPTGALQEAGGILWSDGSAWNFGNQQNPTLPQFNYVKEADYISGASIMIRRSLFETIGRFDSRYAPAYYEDTDLAFEVRRHGYRVMYQPASVVYHFEGVSNGKVVTSGMKAYQVTNQTKFFEKWREVLESEHKPNAVDVYHARDRTIGKKTIIVADNCLPEYDKDAGSRSIYQYIQLFRRFGLTVKFLCQNFYPLQPYTAELEQQGIEVLAGPWFRDNWKQWVADNGENIDYVFISRPHVAETFLPFFREHTSAKIIYNMCDLHFLREMREYEITGNKKMLAQSKRSKETEMEIIRTADVSLTLSTYEQKVLKDYVPPEKVALVPIYMYEDFPVRERGETDGLMFVGGFAHTPNIDAVKWFCSDVLPLIRKEIPGVRFYICGSKPTEGVLRLASEDVIVTGYLTEQELLDMYRSRRVCVIPLRYGAGVKGKTIEALYNSIPTVSTSVGTEGLPGIESCLPPFDTAEDFAAEVIRLYNSDSTERVEAYREYLRDNFSVEKAERILRGILGME